MKNLKKRKSALRVNIISKAIMGLLLALIFLIAPKFIQESRDTSNTYSDDNQYYNVVRIIDGDTFIVNIDGNETRVRLIGVDTPESVATGQNAYKNCNEGKIASDFTKSLIENKSVKLKYDVSETDKYGRHLCYVYLEDGRMLNEVLLEQGYARIMTVKPNNKYEDRFTALEKDAVNNKVGFWGLDQTPWID